MMSVYEFGQPNIGRLTLEVSGGKITGAWSNRRVMNFSVPCSAHSSGRYRANLSVDAGGRDKAGTRRSPGGNPQIAVELHLFELDDQRYRPAARLG
jgi:hypothetical protein